MRKRWRGCCCGRRARWGCGGGRCTAGRQSGGGWGARPLAPPVAVALDVLLLFFLLLALEVLVGVDGGLTAGPDGDHKVLAEGVRGGHQPLVDGADGLADVL